MLTHEPLLLAFSQRPGPTEALVDKSDAVRADLHVFTRNRAKGSMGVSEFEEPGNSETGSTPELPRLLPCLRCGGAHGPEICGSQGISEHFNDAPAGHADHIASVGPWVAAAA